MNRPFFPEVDDFDSGKRIVELEDPPLLFELLVLVPLRLSYTELGGLEGSSLQY